MESSAFFKELDPRTSVELIERYKEDHFSVFPRAASFENGRFVGGGEEPETYILDEDVPIGLERARTDSLEDLLLQKKVIVTVGRRLFDRDKRTNLERHVVTFRTHAPLHTALGRIAWQNAPDSEGYGTLERRFIFPKSNFIANRDAVVSRPNTVLGAAIAASVLGKEIDYYYPLHKAKSKHRRKVGITQFQHPNASLWPLFARYQERQLLDHPYFKAIEEKLE
jgi:hypothetical protein